MLPKRVKLSCLYSFVRLEMQVRRSPQVWQVERSG